MNDYDFILKFDITNLQQDAEIMIEQLYEAGCDDAIIGMGRPGRISLNFIRQAESATAAVTSALQDVNKVLPKARLIEASPDFVGLTDIAEILGCSRQNLRSLHLKHQANFPLPIHEGKATIWHLANVLPWFKGKESYHVADSLLELSRTNMKINLERQIGEAF